MIYVPNGSQEEAKKLSEYLIEKKFVACAHQLPIECYCIWDNVVKSEEEIITIFKTRLENWNFLQKEIERVHPYECPCIIKLDCDANIAYKKWVFEETINCGALKYN